jgi:hypothetical protein
VEGATVGSVGSAGAEVLGTTGSESLSATATVVPAAEDRTSTKAATEKI